MAIAQGSRKARLRRGPGAATPGAVDAEEVTNNAEAPAASPPPVDDVFDDVPPPLSAEEKDPASELGGAPEPPAEAESGWSASRKRTYAAAGFVFLATVALYGGLRHPSGEVTPSLAVTTTAATPTASTSASTVDAGAPELDAKPRTFRVASYKGDDAVELVEATVGKRTLLAAFAKAGLSHNESARVLKAFDGQRRFDKPGPKDTFAFARDKASHRLLAFEYEVSPTEVFQARDTDGHLVAKKLDLTVEKRRVTAGFLVADGLKAAVTQASLDADVLKRLDDALDGHLELADIHAGARLRIVATEARVEGVFSRYETIEAVEYLPPRNNVAPLRVYAFGEGKKAAHYDAKGQRPYHGGWRMPIPLARITSRFNPHRMHPVLHRVMPHNGIDFAGSTGTPVYAVAPGTLKFAADSGPCGNMVQILHSNGLVSAYCHLSKFAPSLKAGQKVEGRQLVGYVGQTGRVTGPHLHFAVKKGAAFIDPLSLKMGGVQVLPKGDREAFGEKKKEMDALLDGIALPTAPVAEADGGAEPDDVNLDEDPDDDK